MCLREAVLVGTIGDVTVGLMVVDGDDVVGCVGAGDDEGAAEAVDRPVGRPWAASALTTASQPLSSVRMRSLSSSFSRSRSRSLSARSRSSTGRAYMAVVTGGAIGIPAPARSRRFSSSSSATRCSRRENWAFRRSREFWAAILLRCARASLRSSELTPWVRGRLREGPAS